MIIIDVKYSVIFVKIVPKVRVEVIIIVFVFSMSKLGAIKLFFIVYQFVILGFVFGL